MASWLKLSERVERARLIPVLSLGLLAALASLLGAEKDPAETRAQVKPVKQPVPFSHRQHSRLGLECSTCHKLAGKGGGAGFPPLALCVSCHSTTNQKHSALASLLKSYDQKGQPIPWIRIYKVPDFVFFSHKHHLAAGRTCRTCHGAVEQRDLLKQEVPTSMKSCMECHKSEGVSVECNFCHELNQ